MFISAFLALIVTRQHYVDSQDEVLAGVSKYIICVFTDGVSECDVNDLCPQSIQTSLSEESLCL